MKKIILSTVALCVISTSALASKILPPPDFSSVEACFVNMQNANMEAYPAFGSLFETASDASLGSMSREMDDNVCTVTFERTSLCRIVNQTNAYPWDEMNSYITEAYSQKAKKNIEDAVQKYNVNKEKVKAKYFTIICRYYCNKKLNIATDCSGNMEE